MEKPILRKESRSCEWLDWQENSSRIGRFVQSFTMPGKILRWDARCNLGGARASVNATVSTLDANPEQRSKEIEERSAKQWNKRGERSSDICKMQLMTWG